MEEQIPITSPASFIEEMKRRWHAYDWNQGARRVAFALLVGIIMGLLAVLVGKCVDWATAVWLPEEMRWLLLLLPVFALFSIWMYNRLHLNRLITGDPTKNHIVEDINANKAYPPQAGPAMLIGTMLSLVGGASVGPEGAAKELGASVGGLLAKWLGLKTPEKPDDDAMAFAMVCGLAACFAALLMVPLGIFAYAIVWARKNQKTTRRWPTILLCVCVACATAYPFHEYFTNPSVRPETIDVFTVSATCIMALTVGLAGFCYHFIRLAIEKGLRSRIKSPYVSALIGALLIVVPFFLWTPSQETGGLSLGLFHEAFAGTAPDWAFAIKILITAVGLGFGLRGGEVTVLLVAGAALGCATSHGMGALNIFPAEALEVAPLCALGLVGLFGVGDTCPIPAVIVGCEFFGLHALPFFIILMLVAWFLEKGLRQFFGLAVPFLREK